MNNCCVYFGVRCYLLVLDGIDVASPGDDPYLTALIASVRREGVVINNMICAYCRVWPNEKACTAHTANYFKNTDFGVGQLQNCENALIGSGMARNIWGDILAEQNGASDHTGKEVQTRALPEVCSKTLFDTPLKRTFGSVGPYLMEEIFHGKAGVADDGSQRAFRDTLGKVDRNG
jgi:hypothetical protein